MPLSVWWVSGIFFFSHIINHKVQWLAGGWCRKSKDKTEVRSKAPHSLSMMYIFIPGYSLQTTVEWANLYSSFFFVFFFYMLIIKASTCNVKMLPWLDSVIPTRHKLMKFVWISTRPLSFHVSQITDLAPRFVLMPPL